MNEDEDLESGRPKVEACGDLHEGSKLGIDRWMKHMLTSSEHIDTKRYWTFLCFRYDCRN